MTVTTAVFDIGNVLIPWDRELLYRSVIIDDDRRQWFLENVLTLEANAVLDRGRPLTSMTADLAAQHPEWSEEISAFASRWVETLGPVLDGTVAVLEELHRANVGLYALTNWGADTFALVEDRYPFFSCFTGMVVSGREGVVKPDAAIFEVLTARYGLDAPSCVFVDDSPANIAAAAALGFVTVRFESATQLRTELRPHFPEIL